MIEGWLYDINSFDQYGVELGKVLAKGVSSLMQSPSKLEDSDLNASTKYQLNEYLNDKKE